MLLQILIIAVAVAAAIIGLAWLTEAQAALILAEARADLIRAEADAIWWHSVTPVVVVVVVGIVATVGLIVWARRKPGTVERVIERQAVVYVLPDNVSRREMRQLAVEQQQPLLLTAGRAKIEVKK